MDPRTLTRLLAAGRVAIGLGLFAAPATAARSWLGDAVDDAGTRMATRGLGARDVALGVGTLVALRDDGPVRPWLDAGVAADLADATAAVLARGERPAGAIGATLAVAGGAAAAGLWLRRALD